MIGGLSAWWVEGAGLVGTGAPSYRGFRYPVEIISHGVWLYYRFPLSFREVQEMMLARGVTVSHETIPSLTSPIPFRDDDAIRSTWAYAWTPAISPYRSPTPAPP
jgi:hypothetical protein